MIRSALHFVLLLILFLDFLTGIFPLAHGDAKDEKTKGLDYIVHAPEDIMKVLKTLNPSWQYGLACFQNKGIESFKANYCKNSVIAETYPIGSLRKEMDDQIVHIEQNLNKKENLDPVDKYFLQWLEVEVANCQREQNDPYLKNKKLRNELVNAKNIAKKFKSLKGKAIPVYRGKALTQDQSTLLLANKIFPFEKIGWSSERFSTMYDGLLADSLFVSTQDKDPKLLKDYFSNGNKINELRKTLFKKYPELVIYAVNDFYTDHRNSRRRFDDSPLWWNNVGLEKSKLPKAVLAEIDVIEHEEDLSRREIAALNANPLEQMILTDDNGVPLKNEGDVEELQFESLSAFGFKTTDPFKLPLSYLSTVFRDNGVIESFEIKKVSAIPTIKASEYYSKLGFNKSEALELQKINEARLHRMLEEEKTIAKILLHDQEIIAKVKALTTESQRIQERIEKIETEIHKEISPFISNKNLAFKNGCDGLKSRLISQFAENKWVINLYNNPQIKKETEENFKKSASWVKTAIENSILSEHSKKAIQERIDNVKLKSEGLLPTPNELTEHYKKANEIYEKLKNSPDFTNDQALSQSVSRFSGSIQAFRRIAVNASYNHYPQHSIRIEAGYLIPKSQNELYLNTFNTYAHEFGHSIDPSISSYDLSKTSSAKLEEARTCLKGDRPNHGQTSEDFADLIANETIGFYLEKNSNVSASSKFQFLQGLLSASCNPRVDVLDNHGKSSDRAIITLNNPHLKKALKETFEYSVDPSKQDCGAKIWKR